MLQAARVTRYESLPPLAQRVARLDDEVHHASRHGGRHLHEADLAMLASVQKGLIAMLDALFTALGALDPLVDRIQRMITALTAGTRHARDGAEGMRLVMIGFVGADVPREISAGQKTRGDLGSAQTDVYDLQERVEDIDRGRKEPPASPTAPPPVILPRHLSGKSLYRSRWRTAMVALLAAAGGLVCVFFGAAGWLFARGIVRPGDILGWAGPLYLSLLVAVALGVLAYVCYRRHARVVAGREEEKAIFVTEARRRAKVFRAERDARKAEKKAEREREVRILLQLEGNGDGGDEVLRLDADDFVGGGGAGRKHGR